MTGAAVDVGTSPDGTLVIHPHGFLGVPEAIELRRALVRAIRHHRPLRLVLDLGDVQALDSINLGTLAAACHLGDDHQVAVFLDHASPAIADDLAAAGVPAHRLRHITVPDGAAADADPQLESAGIADAKTLSGS